MNKEELRRLYSIERQELTKEGCARRSKLICDQIRDWDVFQNANSVAIYMCFHKEVDLRPLLKENKKIIILKMVDDEITLFRVYSEGDCHPGYMQILEPNDTCEKVDDVDLALIPGTCFSEEGGRIGYGKGHYDKFLANSKCIRVGIGYDLQIADSFELEPHDIPMNYLVTDKRIINCGE